MKATRLRLWDCFLCQQRSICWGRWGKLSSHMQTVQVQLFTILWQLHLHVLLSEEKNCGLLVVVYTSMLFKEKKSIWSQKIDEISTYNRNLSFRRFYHLHEFIELKEIRKFSKVKTFSNYVLSCPFHLSWL